MAHDKANLPGDKRQKIYYIGNYARIVATITTKQELIMKKTWLITGLTLTISAYAGLVMSSDATIAKGKELFNDPALGGSPNQSSCGSCHPDGRGLTNAGEKANLADMINMCIQRPLKGQALDEASTEMKALQLYIKSLKE